MARRRWRWPGAAWPAADAADGGAGPTTRRIPNAYELRLLLGEQFIGFFGASARRAHIGSFIRGMWAARREAWDRKA